MNWDIYIVMAILDLFYILKQSRDCLLYTKETNRVYLFVNIWLHYFYLTCKLVYNEFYISC